MRSSRVAEAQSAVALESADPRNGESIAGTFMEVIAAASESTTSAFCDFVFCRSDTITAINVSTTASALTICETATNVCKSIRRANTLSGKQTQTKLRFFIRTCDLRYPVSNFFLVSSHDRSNILGFPIFAPIGCAMPKI